MADRAELPRRNGKRAVVDARHRGRHALRGSQEAARAPVREPEDERNAQRPDERRGQHGVDRAHVRDDRAAAKPGQLAGQRGLEARSAQRLVRRAEGAHAAVLRQHAVDRAVGEHDDLVDELRERADLRDRRRERRMARIDLLRDEDELRH